MGYTHYYYTKSILHKSDFRYIVEDFNKMLGPLEHLGVKIGDGMGDNNPIINNNEIIFNGLRNCGHTQRDLGITWPSEKANGVFRDKVGYGIEQITKSKWFAGASLEVRACGGDCSHETFSIFQQSADNDPRMQSKSGLNFNFTKTAYKPYDLAVNVCLIIAKHYLNDDIEISSDGTAENWDEGKQLCQHFLGYGNDFELKEGDA